MVKRSAYALRIAALGALSATGALGASCGGERTTARTELLLVADTNIAALTSVTFEVSADGHATERQSGDMPGDRSPLTLGVVRDRGTLGPITAVAHGFVGDLEVIARTGVVSFIPGRTVVVPLHLLATCVDVLCEAEQTCTELGCQSATLSADDLHEWTGSPPHIVLQMGLDAAVDDGALGDADIGDAMEPADGGPIDSADPGSDAGDVDSQVDPDDAGDLDSGADAGDLDAGLDAGVASDSGADGLDSGAGDAGDAGASDAGDGGDASTIYDCGTAGSLDLANDPAHCGACSYSCPVTYTWYHASPTCSNYTCGFRCTAPYANCNQVLFVDFDGCEAYLPTDTSNCGACSHKCATNETCVAGVCTP